MNSAQLAGLRAMADAVVTPTFREPDEAFDQAIAEGRLTATEGPLYAGHYMYMGTYNGRDAFKHQMTRRYLA